MHCVASCACVCAPALMLGEARLKLSFHGHAAEHAIERAKRLVQPWDLQAVKACRPPAAKVDLAEKMDVTGAAAALGRAIRSSGDGEEVRRGVGFESCRVHLGDRLSGCVCACRSYHRRCWLVAGF